MSSDSDRPAAPVGALSWEIVDWSADAPFSGHLILSDESGPLVWCALDPVFVRDVGQALKVVHDAQREALVGPVQPLAPLNVAVPTDPPSSQKPPAGKQDTPAAAARGLLASEEGSPGTAAEDGDEAAEDDDDPDGLRRAKRQLIGRFVVAGALLFAAVDTVVRSVS